MDKLGVIGRPSDWLIASDVNYEIAKKKFNINLIDIDINELISLAASFKDDIPENLFKATFNRTELKKAYHIYLALKALIERYNLVALSVRCFDLLDALKSTSCLAFALLNEEGIIATCEGDIPSMISMYLVKKVLAKPSFQANPSRIMIENNEIIFAHCTLPFNMCKAYSFDTHYESGIGVGIKGEMNLDNILIFRLNNTLDKYVLLKGYIKENLHLNNLCRTQIDIILKDDVSYFLKNPLGNHHLIVYENDPDKLKGYLDNLGILQVH